MDKPTIRAIAITVSLLKQVLAERLNDNPQELVNACQNAYHALATNGDIAEACKHLADARRACGRDGQFSRESRFDQAIESLSEPIITLIPYTAICDRLIKMGEFQVLHEGTLGRVPRTLDGLRAQGLISIDSVYRQIFDRLEVGFWRRNNGGETYRFERQLTVFLDSNEPLAPTLVTF